MTAPLLVPSYVSDADARVVRALALVTRATGGTPCAGRLTPCPLCRTGLLGYTVSRDGDVAVHCSSPGCVKVAHVAKYFDRAQP